MRLDRALSQEEFLQQLTGEAEAVWGAERLPGLGPTLATAAGALWELARRSVDVAGEEPDFIGEAE